MTSWPCSTNTAAATDESTPPDMATAMRMLDVRWAVHHEVTKITEFTKNSGLYKKCSVFFVSS